MQMSEIQTQNATAQVISPDQEGQGMDAEKVEGGLGSTNISKHGTNFKVHIVNNDVEVIGGSVACGNQFHTEKLVSGEPGDKMSMKKFCETYALSDTIRGMLEGKGYENSRSLCRITIEQLTRMGFEEGHIATLQEAVEEWSLKPGKK
ncbi:hypothetical protein C8J56DRAFT_881124 [Mycena floridula]|nr:hypothetical protein C8J56DRAFT_881124 [Mycena floridula]